MLTGQELLNKIKALGAISRSEVARACGYVSTKKDGSERINFTAFYEAISEAKGVILAPPEGKAKSGKRGKAPSYKSTIAKTGTCPVGGAYTSQLGWNAGDEISIVVDGDEIRLKRTAVASDEAQAPAAAACEAAPVVVTDTYDSAPAAVAEAVTTYDSTPTRELVGAGAERTPF